MKSKAQLLGEALTIILVLCCILVISWLVKSNQKDDKGIGFSPIETTQPIAQQTNTLK